MEKSKSDKTAQKAEMADVKGDEQKLNKSPKREVLDVKDRKTQVVESLLAKPSTR